MIKKRKRGYYPEKECWDLYIYLAKDIAKALRSFKKVNIHSYPADFGDIEGWHNALDQMIYSFETISKDSMEVYDNADRIQAGLGLFSKHYMDLWD